MIGKIEKDLFFLINLLEELYIYILRERITLYYKKTLEIRFNKLFFRYFGNWRYIYLDHTEQTHTYLNRLKKKKIIKEMR